MKSRNLAITYFSLMGFGFASMFTGIFSAHVCGYPGSYRDEPYFFCNFPFEIPFILCGIIAVGLLVADGFARDLFDD